MIRPHVAPLLPLLTCVLTLAALAALVFVEGACPGNLDDPEEYASGDASTEVAEAEADVAVPTPAEAAATCPDVPTQILAPSCGNAGCHGASSPAAGLDLVSPGLTSRLLDHPAQGGPGLLVDPVKPPDSVLLTKLQASPPFLSRMPLGGAPLDDSAMACVLQWITTLSSGSAGDGAAGDASDDAGEQCDMSPGWLPTASSSTVLWLDARQNVTLTADVVTGWADLSSFHNDAAQTDTTTAPAVDATAVAGLPALTFDETKGTFLSIADAASLQWGTGGYLVAIVGANSKATAGRGHGGGVSTVFAKPQLQSAVELTVHFNFFTTETTDDDSFFETEQGEGEPGLTSTTRGYNDGAARLYVARVDTSSGSESMALRVNGASVGTSTGNSLVDVSLVGSPVRLGSTYGQSVEGAIAEVVAMRGTVSGQDLASLEGYLMTKYHLAADGGL